MYNYIIKLASTYENRVFPRIKMIRGSTFLNRLIKKTALSFISKKNAEGYQINQGVLENKKFAELADFEYLIKEKYYVDLFIESLDKGSVVYDIGSFHGFYSVLGSLGKQVYGFEPDSENFCRLKENADLNESGNIEVFNKAVWSEATDLEIEEEASGKSHISESGGTRIRAVSIDDFVKDRNAPDIMKIDVEGAELKVLEGAKGTIKTHHPDIFIEVHSEEKLESFSSSRKDLELFMSSLGYEIVEDINRGSELLRYYRFGGKNS